MNLKLLKSIRFFLRENKSRKGWSNSKLKKFIKLTDAVQNRLIYNMFINNKLDYDRKKKSHNIIDFIVKNSISKIR